MQRPEHPADARRRRELAEQREPALPVGDAVRRGWMLSYVATYLPVVVVGGLAIFADGAPGWLLALLLVAVPIVIYAVAIRLAATAYERAGIQPLELAYGTASANLLANISDHVLFVVMYSIGLATFGVWAVAFYVLAFAGLPRRWPRVEGASEINTADLPEPAAAMLAHLPDVTLFVAPDHAVPGRGLAKSRRVYVGQSVLDGDEAGLCMALARAAVRLRRGKWRLRLVVVTLLLVSGAGGLLALDVLRGMFYGSGLAPANGVDLGRAMTVAAFGIMLARLLLAPLILWLRRREERAVDHEAIALIGSGRGLIALLNGIDPRIRALGPEPRLFHVLFSSHPTVEERLAYAAMSP